MKKLLTYFFVTLGIVFFVLLCALTYIWFADPFNIRPMIEMLTADTGAVVEIDATIPASGDTSVDKNPALTAEQESALESIGINPANIPSTITPEMETCFITKLGESRVAQIKAGASPSPVEVFTTRDCY
jgi:hypothetical protein